MRRAGGLHWSAAALGHSGRAYAGGEPTGSGTRAGQGNHAPVFALVRQVASSWYALALMQGCTAQQATEMGVMQAPLFLSDLGIVGEARPYLTGARDAMRTAEGPGFGRAH